MQLIYELVWDNQKGSGVPILVDALLSFVGHHTNLQAHQVGELKDMTGTIPGQRVTCAPEAVDEYSLFRHGKFNSRSYTFVLPQDI